MAAAMASGLRSGAVRCGEVADEALREHGKRFWQFAPPGQTPELPKVVTHWIAECIWEKNGDHPNDGNADREGAVVRYYRVPSGPDECQVCGALMHDHGWIDCGGEGITVCPGDTVLCDTMGNRATARPIRSPLSKTTQKEWLRDIKNEEQEKLELELSSGTGTWCGACWGSGHKVPQFNTRSGITCRMGHGGAESLKGSEP